MRGVKLIDLIKMVKVACGDSVQQPASIDVDIALQLALTQETLAMTNDFASLVVRQDVEVTGTTANLPSFNLNRPVKVEFLWNETWEPLTYGIGAEQYNIYAAGEAADPTQRWQLGLLNESNSPATFEVWPTPTKTITVRFTGQRALMPFAADDDVCTLDHLLLVYFTALDRLTLIDPKKTALLSAKANALAASLRAVEHRDNRDISFTAYDESGAPKRKSVPILTV